MVISLPGLSSVSPYLPPANKMSTAAADFDSPDFAKQLSDLIRQSLKESGESAASCACGWKRTNQVVMESRS
jgi:hypothetical protein